MEIMCYGGENPNMMTEDEKKLYMQKVIEANERRKYMQSVIENLDFRDLNEHEKELYRRMLSKDEIIKKGVF